MTTDQERIAGVVVADATQPGYPMTYISPGFEKLTGYSTAEVLGRSCSLLQGPETDPRAVAVLRDAIREGREAYVTLRNYRKDGTAFWNEVALAPQRDENGRLIRYLGVQKDVSHRIRNEERMRELAYSDALTGLSNRAALTDELTSALAEARVRDTQLALLFIDIDDFKRVNDSYGHASGDAVLGAVAERLRAVVRPTDLLARPGGDEFSLLIRDVADVSELVETIASRVVDCVREPVILADGTAIQVRVSVGVSAYPRDARTEADLMGHADVAMYIAKGAGKNGFHLYRREDRKTGHRDDPDFDPADEVDELDRILGAGDVTAVYQPIVEVEGERIVGYEALARGPEGSVLHRPDRLFAVADHAGRVAELDWLCRATAVRGAIDAGLGRAATLFLNCEPSAIGVPCPAEHAAVWARAQGELDLVLEITERALLDRPADLSRVVGEERGAGRGIALDDVGADVRSLALLPFVEPDVVKLDLRLVQSRPSIEQAAIVAAVAAESERTGAAILAEGVETDAHVMIARALGATLGQGYRWGRPGPLPATRPRPWRRPAVMRSERSGSTPFEVVAAGGVVAETTKRLLLPMSHHLENQALRVGEGAVLLSAFQDARHFTPHTLARYEMLARGASLVAALGTDLPLEPAAGVRGAHIGADDPLAGEWSVIVISPHFTGALVAQDLGDTGRESDRRFAFTTTYERALVIAAARTLLERIVPNEPLSDDAIHVGATEVPSRA